MAETEFVSFQSHSLRSFDPYMVLDLIIIRIRSTLGECFDFLGVTSILFTHLVSDSSDAVKVHNLVCRMLAL